MNSKIALLFLGVILLLKGYDAAPLYHDMDSAVSAVKERLLLAKLIASEMNEMILEVLQNGNDVFEKLLKDPEISNIKSDTIQSKLEEMRAYIKDFEEYKETMKTCMMCRDKLPDLRERLNKIGMTYEGEDKPLENDEDKMIGKFLKDNKFGKYKLLNMDRVKTFTEKAYAQIEYYYKNIDDARKEDESQLKDFMKAFNDETDLLKRGTLIVKLIESFELEQFLW